jgi:hypothetical protein
MRGRRGERIETIVDHVAAALFAVAAGLAVLRFATLTGLPPVPAGLAAGALGYVLCNRLLRAVGGGPQRFALPEFELADIAPTEPDELLLTEQAELVLTEADRLPDAVSAELVLNDILARMTPDSRVVRLFDPAAMPTPGQLNARIERHLSSAPAEPPTDDSQALYDALTQLRRSLR